MNNKNLFLSHDSDPRLPEKVRKYYEIILTWTPYHILDGDNVSVVYVSPNGEEAIKIKTCF